MQNREEKTRSTLFVNKAQGKSDEQGVWLSVCSLTSASKRSRNAAYVTGFQVTAAYTSVL